MPRHLVLQLARFGDLLQSKRLVASLCARGETHLCVDTSLAPLAGLVYPEATVHALDAHGGRPHEDVFKGCRDLLAMLGTLDFDLVCNLNYSGLNLALSAFFPPEIVRGHKLAAGQPLRSHWYEMGFRWTRRRQSSPLNLVDFWAWLLDAPIAGDELNPRAIPKGGGVGVVLAGRDARRSLPMDVLVPLARTILQGQGGTRVVLLGSKSEQPAARDFLNQAPGAFSSLCRDLTGKTDWAGLMEALQGLDLVLTPDTGVMHLAAHLGTPVLGCFLSSAWAWETGPYGHGHVVLQGLQECSPCIESRPCYNDLRCLEPFGSRELFRILGKGLDFSGQELPPGLAALGNEFDDFGQRCTPLAGSDPHAKERAAQRALLREARLGVGPLSEAREAQNLYLERDWMLEAIP